ncbi:hypothetical protein P4639_25410 [Priestia megaterium]|uniref:hypothetical protein n=1 Tax=Priestia megaterium TaxID=1404 RepID=UPI002E1F7021|nr:hypothetical protein [Priestia megaterium]
MQMLRKKEDLQSAALNELNKLIQTKNIDLSTYICPDGSLDIKALLQDYGMEL